MNIRENRNTSTRYLYYQILRPRTIKLELSTVVYQVPLKKWYHIMSLDIKYVALATTRYQVLKYHSRQQHCSYSNKKSKVTINLRHLDTLHMMILVINRHNNNFYWTMSHEKFESQDDIILTSRAQTLKNNSNWFSVGLLDSQLTLALTLVGIVFYSTTTRLLLLASTSSQTTPSEYVSQRSSNGSQRYYSTSIS